MAIELASVQPIDTKPGTAVGIALPLNQPAVFKSTYYTKDAIKANLINFFLTNRNERYLNNDFGGNIRDFIFEAITEGTTDFLKEDIQSKVNLYFPNVEIVELEVLNYQDQNTIVVKFNYKIINTDITDEIELTF